MPVLKYRPDESSSWQTVGTTVDGYSKEETDTLLQNKPSKSPVHVDDANDVTKSGFYTCKTNIPFGYGLANVLAVGDIDDTNNIFTQIAFGVNLNPTNRNAIAVRCYVPGEGFKDWEWFNPPMTLGVEYRTIERYQEKPVYAKLVDFGSLPNSTRKDLIHGISNIKNIVFSAVRDSSGDFIIAYRLITDFLVTTSKIRIETSSDYSGSSAYVLMKYTKTTD